MGGPHPGGPHPRVSDSVGLGWCPIICILTGSQVMPWLLVLEAHLRTPESEAHLPVFPARESHWTSWSRVPVYVSAAGLLGARCLAQRTHRTSFVPKLPTAPRVPSSAQEADPIAYPPPNFSPSRPLSLPCSSEMREIHTARVPPPSLLSSLLCLSSHPLLWEEWIIPISIQTFSGTSHLLKKRGEG